MTPVEQRHHLRQLIILLQRRLQKSGDWYVVRPAPEAFDSIEPFCIDRMNLQQWLRYVFVARLHALLDRDAALPLQCSVTPQLEMMMTQASPALFEVTLAIDELLTNRQLPAEQLLAAYPEQD